MYRSQIDQYSAQWSYVEHWIQVATGKSSIKILNAHKYPNQTPNKNPSYESIINITDFGRDYIKRVVDKTIPINDVVIHCGHINLYQPHEPSKLYSLFLCRSQLGIIGTPTNFSTSDSTLNEPQSDQDTFQYNFLLRTHEQYQILYQVTFNFNDERQFKINQYQCSNCQNRRPQVFCKSENLLFCDECCHQHHQTKLMQTHHLQLMNKVNTLPSCKNHNCKYQYYCLKCEKYLCQKCLLKGIHHENHEHPVKLISYLYEQNKEMIDVLPKRHRQKIQHLQKTLKIKTKEVDDNHQEVLQYLEKIHNQSIKQLTNITQSKLRLLFSTEVQLKMLNDKLQWLKAFIKFQQKSIKPMHFLTSAQKYQQDLKKMQINEFEVIFTTKPDTIALGNIIVGQRNQIDRAKKTKSSHSQDPKSSFNFTSKSSSLPLQKRTQLSSYNPSVAKPGELYSLLSNSNLNFFKSQSVEQQPYKPDLLLFYLYKRSIKQLTMQTPFQSNTVSIGPRIPQKQKNAKQTYNNPQLTKNPMTSHYQTVRQQIYDLNADYLAQKVKICETPKPSKYHHKMPSRVGCSEYQKFANSMQISTQMQRDMKRSVDCFKMSPMITPKNNPLNTFISSYKKDYRQNSSSNHKQRKIQTQYSKNDAPPLDNKTSYNQSYLYWDYKKPCKAVKRKDNQILTGGSTKKHTVYNDTYAQKKVRVSQPIVHKDNQVIMNIQNPPTTSNYQSSYPNHHQSMQVDSCKPKPEKNKPSHKMRYKTQYSGQYANKNSHNRKEFSCMTTNQLKEFILNQ